MTVTVKKTSALMAAALAAAFVTLPMGDAEARNGRKGALIGGLAAGALIGGALLAAPRAYGHPYYAPAYGGPAYGGPIYVEPEECYVVTHRVWDDYRGRFVRVRERVCE